MLNETHLKQINNRIKMVGVRWTDGPRVDWRTDGRRRQASEQATELTTGLPGRVGDGEDGREQVEESPGDNYAIVNV